MFLRLIIVMAAFTFGPAAIASDPMVEIIDSATGLSMYKYEIDNHDDSTRHDMHILKINPSFYEFRLLAAMEIDSVSRTPAQWCSEFGYEFCFNAGMYAADNFSPLGYCKSNGNILNPRINYHKALLAFNPRYNSISAFKIINRGCEDIQDFEDQYASMVQSVRMIGCAGGNVWNQSDNKHSILALATDSSGAIYVLFAAAPMSVHDFINYALKINPGFDDMIYLEGSVPASLYVKTGDYLFNISGVAESLWPLWRSGQGSTKLPNVIAARKKQLGEN